MIVEYLAKCLKCGAVLESHVSTEIVGVKFDLPLECPVCTSLKAVAPAQWSGEPSNVVPFPKRDG